MVWTVPVAGVPGAVITGAWSQANVVNPINWLRLMNGNADPPGSDYVVVSSSTTATAWGKVTSDAIADGAILPSKLTFTPVNKSGDTHVGTLQSDGDLRAVNVIASTDIIGGRVWATVNDGSTVPMVIFNRVMVPNLNAEMVGGQTLANLDTRFVNTTGDTMTGNLTVNGGDVTTNSRFISTVPSPTAPIVVSSAVQCPNLNAEMVAGLTLTGLDARYVNTTGDTMSGGLTVNSGSLTVNGGDVTTASRFISTVSSPTSPIILNSAVECVNLNAHALQGRVPGAASGNLPILNAAARVADAEQAQNIQGWVPTATPGPNRVPVSDATGTLNAWVLGSGIVVPVDGVIGWDNAGTIPAGWTRFTAADGRLLIGAGVSFSVTWAQGVSYPTSGGSWSHDHLTTTVTPTSTFTGTGPTTTAADATHVQQSSVATPQPNVSLGTHVHTMTVPTGTVSTTLSGNVGDTSWQPAMRGIVWIKRV